MDLKGWSGSRAKMNKNFPRKVFEPLGNYGLDENFDIIFMISRL